MHLEVIVQYSVAISEKFVCFTKAGSLHTYPPGAAEQSQWLSRP